MTDKPEEPTERQSDVGATAEWGIAKVVESPEEATLIAGFLGSCGIPAEVESLHVEELPVLVGGLGELRVRVPAERLSEALALLERQELAGPSSPDLDAAALESAAPESGPPHPRDRK